MVDYSKQSSSGYDDPNSAGELKSPSGIYRQLPPHGTSSTQPAIEWHYDDNSNVWVNQGRIDKKSGNDHQHQKEFLETLAGGGGIDPQTTINTAAINNLQNSQLAQDIAIANAEISGDSGNRLMRGTDNKLFVPPVSGGGGTDPQTAINTGQISVLQTTTASHGAQINTLSTNVTNLQNGLSSANNDLTTLFNQQATQDAAISKAEPSTDAGNSIIYGTDGKLYSPASGGGGGGATSFALLSDTTINAVARGDLAVFNGTTWQNMAKGIDGEAVIADSSTATGLRYGAIGGDKLRYLYVDDFGAVGDGVTDDAPAIQSALDAVQEGDVLYFTPKKTYLMSTRAFRPMNASFGVIAYGATIKIDDFAQYLECFKISHSLDGVNSVTSPSDYHDNEFFWFGGTIDQNGQNQHFAWADRLRDGTGVQDAAGGYNTATGAAFATATPQKYGPGSDWPINPLSQDVVTNNIDNKGDSVVIIGYARARFRDVKTINRVENGLTGFNCGVTLFESCSDYNAIETNDQFVISYINGGNASRGHQHFAYVGSQARSHGDIYADSVAGFNVGDEVRGPTVDGHATRPIGTIYEIDSTKNIIKVNFVKGRRFRPGDTLDNVTTGNNGLATANVFELKPRGVTVVLNCDSEQGNTTAGYIGVFNDAIGSGLIVQGGHSRNQGTANYRCEGGEFAYLNPASCENTGGIRCDSQKLFSFASQQCYNVNNDVRDFVFSCPRVLNMRVHTEDGIDAEHQIVRDTNFVFDDTAPIPTHTGQPLSTQVVAGKGVKMINCRVRGEVASTPTGYNVGSIMSNSGVIDGLYFENVDRVAESVKTVRNVEGKNCNFIATNITSTSTVQCKYKSINVENVANFAFDIRSGSEPHIFDQLDVRNTGQAVFRCADAGATQLIVRNSDFTDIGTDTSSSAQERAVVGGSTGIRLETLKLINNSFNRTTSNATQIKYHGNGQNDLVTVFDYSSIESDAIGSGWSWVKGSNTRIKWLLENAGFDSSTIAAGSVSLTRYTPLLTLNGEGAAADDIDTLNVQGIDHGMEIVIMQENTSIPITIKHGTGNFDCNGSDITLNALRRTAKFIRRGNTFYLL